MSIGSFGRIVSPKKIAQHHKLFFHAVKDKNFIESSHRFCF
jgi:hypothetical protein